MGTHAGSSRGGGSGRHDSRRRDVRETEAACPDVQPPVEVLAHNKVRVTQAAPAGDAPVLRTNVCMCMHAENVHTCLHA
eukprot:364254-Chlamydomonas_euryale.AAC.15